MTGVGYADGEGVPKHRLITITGVHTCRDMGIIILEYVVLQGASRSW